MDKSFKVELRGMSECIQTCPCISSTMTRHGKHTFRFLRRSRLSILVSPLLCKLRYVRLDSGVPCVESHNKPAGLLNKTPADHVDCFPFMSIAFPCFSLYVDCFPFMSIAFPCFSLYVDCFPFMLPHVANTEDHNRQGVANGENGGPKEASEVRCNRHWSNQASLA